MPDRPQTSIDRLRDAVAIRVQATSLRAVARQVGMSASGLHKFIAGGMPYTKSRRKLFRWLQREKQNLHSDLSMDVVASAVTCLLTDVPPARQERAARALVDALRDVYARHTDTPPPPWLAELTRRMEDAAAPPAPDRDASTEAGAAPSQDAGPDDAPDAAAEDRQDA